MEGSFKNLEKVRMILYFERLMTIRILLTLIEVTSIKLRIKNDDTKKGFHFYQFFIKYSLLFKCLNAI